MHVEITPLSKYNFHDVVTLIAAIMKESGVKYKRVEAESYLRSHSENTRVLEVAGNIMGMYAYSEHSNSYTLNFLALNPSVRRQKIGYELYKHMKNHLKGKPVLVPMYSSSNGMLSIFKKRGTFVGRFQGSDNQTIEYYTLNFGDKEWTE